MNKIKFLKIRLFLLLSGILLCFWWPLSHLFYSDLYHSLLGFKTGSYQDSMVKMIGICGFLPVMMLFSAVTDPLKNKDMLKILSLFSFLLSGTYIFLIQSELFPVPEYFNVALSLFFGIILFILSGNLQ